MFKIKIAQLIIEIHNLYPDVEEFCKEYIVTSDHSDISIEIFEEDIRQEADKCDFDCSNAYLERSCVYRKICLELPKYDAFLLHASVLSVDSKGYCFLGKSGIGKTTQTKLWLNYFGDRALIVNGDKPIIRYEKNPKGGTFYAYGTPWSGKENMQTNTFVPVKAFCFLEQSLENKIHALTQEELINRLFYQCQIPTDAIQLQLFLDLCDKLVENIPSYLLECRPEMDAVTLAWNTMNV